MRFLPLAVLLLAGCSTEPAVPTSPTGHFAGEGRDALCIVGEAGRQRAGFVAYGEGNNNCSARGRVEVDGANWALVPDGEGDCRITFKIKGDSVSLGAGRPSCSYYCGPDISFAEKSFQRANPADAAAADRNPMVDFAGEPLC
ncbi:MAG: hypothetical protein M3Q57_08530 [Pseudomonadota bacterium]|nr:hypothetical protein [Pseudomonadota bacterium]